MAKESEKRLAVDVDKITHSHIKKVCVDREISIRKWIEEAIADKIKKDINLGFK
jgi:hypothetical protein